MITFRVEGPLEVKPLHGPYGRIIQKEFIERFWEDNSELAEVVGCYIFGMRTGGGLTPIYVGQSTTGFKHECFQHHKLTHYNEALALRTGTPIMFFLVKESGPQSILETCLDQVEHYLIQLAVQHNPDLANVKRVEWSIPGLFNAGPGRPSASVKELRRILGVVHPTEPAVPRTPEDETVFGTRKEEVLATNVREQPAHVECTSTNMTKGLGLPGTSAGSDPEIRDQSEMELRANQAEQIAADVTFDVKCRPHDDGRWNGP